MAIPDYSTTLSEIEIWPLSSYYMPGWDYLYNLNLGLYQEDLHDILSSNAAMYSDLIGKHNRGESLTDYATSYEDDENFGFPLLKPSIRRKELPSESMPSSYLLATPLNQGLNTSFKPEGLKTKKDGSGFNPDASVSRSVYNMGNVVNSFYNRINPNIKHNRTADLTIGTIGRIGSNIPGWTGVAITGASTMASLLDNTITTKVNDLKLDKGVLARQGSSWLGLSNDLMKADSELGRFSFFNSVKASNLRKRIKGLKPKQGALAAIDNTVQDWRNLASTPSYAVGRERQLEGYEDNFRMSAKQGAKLEKPIETKQVVTHIELAKPITSFKMGGTVNVIPEGALHARLHHMDNDENITKKGIPVVSEKEGGEIEQHAEIERLEIIFRLDVTKTLEELLKKYDSDEYTLKEKDEFALEAGKLLVEEILYNTIDNTNNLI